MVDRRGYFDLAVGHGAVSEAVSHGKIQLQVGCNCSLLGGVVVFSCSERFHWHDLPGRI